MFMCPFSRFQSKALRRTEIAFDFVNTCVLYFDAYDVRYLFEIGAESVIVCFSCFGIKSWPNKQKIKHNIEAASLSYIHVQQQEIINNLPRFMLLRKIFIQRHIFLCFAFAPTSLSQYFVFILISAVSLAFFLASTRNQLIVGRFFSIHLICAFG